MKKIFFLLFLIVSFSVFSVHAEVSFEAGISIEKEAENSAIAKEEAMKDAYRQALLKVSERLTTKENVDKINNLTDTQLIHFIKEMIVIAEKNTKNGYLADLNIKINGDLLKQYMIENDMINIVTTPSEVLVIPLFSDTEYNGMVLFEDGNVWRTALLQKGEIKAGNIKIDIIDDDPSLHAIFTPDLLLDMSSETYEKIHFITQAKQIYVVHAVKAGQNTLILLIKKYNGEEKRILVTTENEDLFDKAIEKMATYIALIEEEKDVVQSSYQSKINVIFEYQQLKEWLLLQQKLNLIPVIKNIETDAMENGRVLFSIEFSGTLENLTDLLNEQNLKLEFKNSSYLIFVEE